MSNSINRLTIGGNTGVFALPYGTCSDSASTVAKTASKTGFVLGTGAVIVVKFSNTNTATNPTLNVNGTGAKSICQYGTTAVGNTTETSWQAGASIPLVYDGTNWITVSPLSSTIINDGDLAGEGSSIVKSGSSWVATFANGQQVLISSASVEGEEGWELTSDQDLCTVHGDATFGYNCLYLGMGNTITLYNFDGYDGDGSVDTLENSGTKLGTLQYTNATWSIVD